MDDYKIQSDMYVLPLGDYDVVLGVQWMMKLGPILLYFYELWMQFKVKEYRYTLKELKEGSLQLISSHRMEKLLKKELKESWDNYSLFTHPCKNQEKYNCFNMYLLIILVSLRNPMGFHPITLMTMKSSWYLGVSHPTFGLTAIPTYRRMKYKGSSKICWM